ncbi:hypothetical protein ACEP1K_31415 [Pseudomonas aeruginosa]|nr:hypothetical protein [Pseudomonas aeruginosa]HDS0931207.1 hypothetical protein [Pseudomonas putida]EIU3462792.1 hypothetical protein [Pseudomonas aeruginosa]EKP5714168.1 hypothetical protein [Pseudomonas aeruginosa]MBT1081094.1 hypothetical protein [Pseudomonas aeruginosa]MBX5859753.1 hypothetical protein [Pseudomonas aeruginosa]
MEEKVYKEAFSISYDDKEGDLSRHVMDAKTLGQAILAVHDLLNAAHSQLGKGSKIEVSVAAAPKEGSLVVEFILMAASLEPLTLLKTLGFVAGGATAGGGLMEVVRQMRSRKVTQVDIDEATGTAKISVQSEQGQQVEVIECSKAVARLATDKKTRDALHAVIQVPISGAEGGVFKVLKTDPVDETKTEVLVAVKEEDAHQYSTVPAASLKEVESKTEKATVCFTQVNFDSPKGWRAVIGAGDDDYAVEMADDTFLKKVQGKQQAFLKGDLFEVTLEEIKSSSASRSDYKRVIKSVDRHFAGKDRRLT